MRFYTKTIFFLLFMSVVHASAENYFKDKPGFIEQNLKIAQYDIDTSAVAVVLYEKYDYDLTGTTNVIECKVRKVIRILKKGGVQHGNVDLPLYYSHSHSAKIKKISGTTYNLEGGKVTEQPLDAENIFKGSYEHLKEKKFSMPAVREGSIIDYSYVIEEEFSRNFCNWEIQENIPKLHSEIELLAPYTIEIVMLSQYAPVFTKTEAENEDTISSDAVSKAELIRNIITGKRLIRKNIPAITNEPFVANINNYRERIQFFIKGFISSGGLTERYDTWDKINDFLLKSPKFGKAILGRQPLVSAKTAQLTNGENDELEKAKKIYQYVRDSVTAHGQNHLLIENGPGDVLQNKTGTSSEINMLLVCMLRSADIDCSPVILSTKENGQATDVFPDIDRFNYTVCEARIDGHKYYLDASGKFAPFGLLPENCYNGYARIVDKESAEIAFSPDAAKERFGLTITTTDNSIDNYVLSATCSFGPFSAMRYRQIWNNDSDEIKKYCTALVKQLPFHAHLANYSVQNLTDPGLQLLLSINVTVDWPKDVTTLYFAPYYSYFETNPFKNEVRKYNVELPYAYYVTYSCRLKLPAGYDAEDIMPPLTLNFDNNAQCIDKANYDPVTNTLFVSSTVHMFKAVFTKEEYPGLKEFFDKMFVDQQKNLVIKKL